jgi:hypothetical protein
VFVELLVCNDCLHSSIEIARADLQDPVHRREIEAHSAPQRHDMALQAGAASKGNHRYFMMRTNLDDLAHLLGSTARRRRRQAVRRDDRTRPCHVSRA